MVSLQGSTGHQSQPSARQRNCSSSNRQCCLDISVSEPFFSLHTQYLKYGRKPEHQQEENALHSGVRTHSVSSIFPHLTAVICPTQQTLCICFHACLFVVHQSWKLPLVTHQKKKGCTDVGVATNKMESIDFSSRCLCVVQHPFCVGSETLG